MLDIQHANVTVAASRPRVASHHDSRVRECMLGIMLRHLLAECQLCCEYRELLGRLLLGAGLPVRTCHALSIAAPNNLQPASAATLLCRLRLQCSSLPSSSKTRQ